MQALRFGGVAMSILVLGIASACNRQSPIPIAASTVQAAEDARLPFDREAQADGISPTSSVVPPGAQVPAGTPVTIRLQTKLSSASTHRDDRFKAILDEPLTVNGQIVADRGTEVTGRVVAAGATGQLRTPGYLRLTLHTIRIEGKPASVRTSSTFLKGSAPRRGASVPAGNQGTLIGAVSGSRAPLIGNAMAEDSNNLATTLATPPREVTVGPDRRLTFRLIEPILLNP